MANKFTIGIFATAAVSAGLFAYFGYVAHHVVPSADISAIGESVYDQSGDTESHRVYRYSVVPGGIWHEEDFARAIKDKVVAKHYADLDTNGTLKPFTTIAEPSEAHEYYVSYRKNNTIYWTRKPVAVYGVLWVVPGNDDTLQLVRARCGNRLSETPMRPTLNAVLEPSPDVLNDYLSVEPQLPLNDKVARSVAPEIIPYTPGSLLLAPPASVPTSETDRTVPVAWETPMRSEFIDGGPIAILPPAGAVVVPEPRTVRLLMIGFLGWLFMVRKTSK